MADKTVGNPKELEPGRFARVSLRPSLEAPAQARRIVAGFAGDSAGETLRFALRLTATELVKNAVLYGSRDDPIRLELSAHRDWVELRVTNGGSRIRMTELRSRREDGGRGLEIVDALTWGWSIDSGPLETSVSVRVPIVDSAADRAPLPRLAQRDTGYDDDMPERGESFGVDRRARQTANGRGRS